MGDLQKFGLKKAGEKAGETRVIMQNIDFQSITMFYKRLNVNARKTMAMVSLNGCTICHKLEGRKTILIFCLIKPSNSFESSGISFLLKKKWIPTLNNTLPII